MNRSKGQGKGKVRKTFPCTLSTEESKDKLNQKRGVERPEKKEERSTKEEEEGKEVKKERSKILCYT